MIHTVPIATFTILFADLPPHCTHLFLPHTVRYTRYVRYTAFCVACTRLRLRLPVTRLHRAVAVLVATRTRFPLRVRAVTVERPPRYATTTFTHCVTRYRFALLPYILLRYRLGSHTRFLHGCYVHCVLLRLRLPRGLHTRTHHIRLLLTRDALHTHAPPRLRLAWLLRLHI